MPISHTESVPFYVETRVYRWDADTDGSFPLTPGHVASHTVPFENLANATAVYEDTERVLAAAAASGLPAMTERAKPGRRRKNQDLGIAT